MPHVYYHCGILGDKIETGPLEYPTWSKGVVLWRLNVDDDHLEKKVEKRARKMAGMISDALGGEVQPMTQLHGYCSIGVGEIDGYQTLETYYGSDYFMVQWFRSEAVTHAVASTLDVALIIERYKTYLDVFKVTGTEIHLDY
jgi:hypothetical protein